MIFKISSFLLLVFVCGVHSSCTNVANEDKIDCVQHESWTPQSCIAKGCCHAEVPGFPACYYPFGNKHEARCMMSVGERRDCGNADTTEISCIKQSCCWQMTPGAPFCYRAKEGVSTNTPIDTTVTEENTDSTYTPLDSTVTDNPNTDVSTQLTDGPTEGPVNNPPECKTVKDNDKVDCAASEPNWTPHTCVAKGCCYIEVAGYPACFFTSNHHQDGNCDVANGQKTDCGDSTTTESECKNKGCCWNVTPGAPACYNKKASPFWSYFGVKDRN